MEVPRLGVESELWLWPTAQPQQHGIQAASATYTTAYGNARSLTHWARPEIKPATSRLLVRFNNHWAMTGTLCYGSLYSTEYIEISPFLFLILFIWVISLLFLVSLARVCQFCLPFQRTSLGFIDFFLIVFWIFILLICSLIFLISFLLLTLGFVCSFSNPFRW